MGLDKYKDYVTIDVLLTTTKLWISGKHYGEISKILRIEIDKTLDILNHFIGYVIANIVSKIIRIKEQHLEDDQTIDRNIIDWTLFLQNGIKSRLQLLLIQLGFSERVGLWYLSVIIELLGSSYFESEDELKIYLIDNNELLLNATKNFIPAISFLQLKKNYDFITNVFEI